jgi:hypothetical protein
MSPPSGRSTKRFARSANFDRFTAMSFSYGSELQRTIHMLDHQQVRCTPMPVPQSGHTLPSTEHRLLTIKQRLLSSKLMRRRSIGFDEATRSSGPRCST